MKLNLFETDNQLVREKFSRTFNSDDGNIYDAITTIINKTEDTTFLESWKERIGKEEADSILRASSKRGNTVHQILTNYIKTGEVKKTKNDLYDDIVQGIVNHLEENVTKVFLTESPVKSDKFQIAGVPDLVCIYQGKPTVIDFKTAKSERRLDWCDKYLLQAVLYTPCIYEMFDLKCQNILAIVGLEDSMLPQIVPGETGEWFPKAMKRVRQYRKEYYNV